MKSKLKVDSKGHLVFQVLWLVVRRECRNENEKGN